MTQRRVISAVTAAVLAVGLAAAAIPAQAVSATNSYSYPGGRYLQANVWLENQSGRNFNWTSSSKYLGSGSGPSTASSITNEVKIWVNGVGVSLGNASGATTSDKDFGLKWTNTNTWISDLAGSNSVTNLLYLNINGSSFAIASIPYFGTPKSTTATVTKWL
ncbi:hypothetical protein [Cellulomonas fimi]|uniref:Secreted protein n=1 Tax=Cellulomonas fimi (strain ATCC 484 / DSM 20113 / JCM 1341 / CCUG 24087 / LMG 16345 / NBRC 15513 / NCIMB 8980 / NCTC 7547 / NRS-133) TaxID=590998 RepID=F4H4P1_CELFA|nr:hypothetical protein [Cellulomonas fimi]AEE44242.1 hypothetical protein Celf_0092 [Cellulomonas fimi ATCC 484]NNH05689.1 hypothetical protein [Cellulomonas fimi]VEH25954.1 Uncharacterised protein [Cellulomonas fimi]